MTAVAFNARITAELQALQDAGVRKTEHVITSAQGASATACSRWTAASRSWPKSGACATSTARCWAWTTATPQA
ncbi:hypothetical protein [Silanimonas sp.]|uniref:hypothetical protein n=1 Tax=Silanimonas sp. TaxID=1929290 RepID=UPI0021792501|nr:hypothetical protein [Silanimonas sp.]MCA3242611.1 hypothetical protein [Rubrivivax sp.]MCA3251981.1 hypothetical protein [Rubrivivax sp.]MCZ8031750.1 hypothetical protein [Rubrivivax sp.]MCZ8167066.1 hypothetical protein [Silanimonas sp.]